ncbi:MAG: hypothetical protein LC664_02540 [Flavobacteriales bacterium]|nr:hypothetical protein [Flavobacteriales bacterium]
MMKPIKSVYTALAAFVLSLGAVAQSAEDYSALSEFIPQEKLSALESNSPLEYNQLAYLNRNGYHLSEVGDKTVETEGSAMEVQKLYADLPDITASMVENQELNLMGYNFKISPDKYTYYSLGNSNSVLVIPPSNLSLEKANLLNP